MLHPGEFIRLDKQIVLKTDTPTVSTKMTLLKVSAQINIMQPTCALPLTKTSCYFRALLFLPVKNSNLCSILYQVFYYSKPDTARATCSYYVISTSRVSKAGFRTSHYGYLALVYTCHVLYGAKVGVDKGLSIAFPISRPELPTRPPPAKAHSANSVHASKHTCIAFHFVISRWRLDCWSYGR